MLFHESQECVWDLEALELEFFKLFTLCIILLNEASQKKIIIIR